MLKTRVLVTTAVFAVLFGTLWIDLHFQVTWGSFSLLVLFGTAAALEYNRIMARSVPTYPLLLAAAAVLYPLVELWRIRAGRPGGPTDFLFFFLFLVLLFGRAVLAGHVQQGFDRVARTLLGFVLLFLFYRLASVLLDPSWKGLTLAYTVVVVSKCSDMGAFLAGYFLGRRKLIPKVSPGKTWWGAAGGLLLPAGAGAAAFLLLEVGAPFAGALFGLVIGFATILSDLSESLLKRCAGVKDSAALLPELGGVLDMIDSLIFAAPAGYLMLRFLHG